MHYKSFLFDFLFVSSNSIYVAELERACGAIRTLFGYTTITDLEQKNPPALLVDFFVIIRRNFLRLHSADSEQRDL